MIEILKDYIGEALVAIVGGLITWLSTRSAKKTAAAQAVATLKAKDEEIAKLRIDNGNQIMEQYQKALDDLEVRYDKKHEYLNADYKRRLEDLREDYERRIEFINQTNEEKYKQLETTISNLKRNLDTWKDKYRQLKSDYDKFKASQSNR